jgi:hypothetical protein
VQAPVNHDEDLLQQVFDVSVADPEALEAEPHELGVRLMNGPDVGRRGARSSRRDLEVQGHVSHEIQGLKR